MAKYLGADNPVQRLNVHLSLLVERFVPTKVSCVRNKDMPWFNDDCRRVFNLEQEVDRLLIALKLTGMFLFIIHNQRRKFIKRREASLVSEAGMF